MSMPAAYGAGVQRSMPFLLVGGISGTGMRWVVGEVLSSPGAVLLTVNTFGCLILGVVTVIGRAPGADASGTTAPSRPSPIRLGLTVGFCGGLTTFSGLTVDLMSRWRDGTGGAWVLGVSSLAIGIAAVMVGRSLGRRVSWSTS